MIPTNEEAVSWIKSHDYNRVASPAGIFHWLYHETPGRDYERKRECLLLALNGETSEPDRISGVGTRSGCKSGYGVRRNDDDVMEIVYYRAAKTDPVPVGTKETVLAKVGPDRIEIDPD